MNNLKKTLNKLHEILSNSNDSIYLVGGVVRDLFLKKESLDIDIVTDGKIEDILSKLLPAFPVRKITNREEFLTCSLFLKTGISIDIAKFRTEKYLKSGALPIVTATSKIEEDYRRRDFTINSMYLSFGKNTELYDPTNGKKDLENKLIRVLHEKSFVDDPTRILRGIKFAGRYGFNFSPETEELIFRGMEENLLGNISTTRMKNELYNLFKEKNLLAIILLLKKYGVFKFLNIFKIDEEEVRNLISFIKTPLFKKFKKTKDISKGTFILVALTENMEFNERLKFFKEFGLSEKNIYKMIFTGEEFSLLKDSLTFSLKNSEIYYALKKLNNFKLLYLAYKDRKNREKIEVYVYKLLEKSGIITGDTLIKLGFEQGPKLKEYTNEAFKIQLDMEDPTEEKVLNELWKKKK